MMVNGDNCPENMKISSKRCKEETFWSTGISCSCFMISVLVLVHMYGRIYDTTIPCFKFAT